MKALGAVSLCFRESMHMIAALVGRLAGMVVIALAAIVGGSGLALWYTLIAVLYLPLLLIVTAPLCLLLLPEILYLCLSVAIFAIPVVALLVLVALILLAVVYIAWGLSVSAFDVAAIGFPLLPVWVSRLFMPWHTAEWDRFAADRCA